MFLLLVTFAVFGCSPYHGKGKTMPVDKRNTPTAIYSPALKKKSSTSKAVGGHASATGDSKQPNDSDKLVVYKSYLEMRDEIVEMHSLKDTTKKV